MCLKDFSKEKSKQTPVLQVLNFDNNNKFHLSDGVRYMEAKYEPYVPVNNQIWKMLNNCAFVKLINHDIFITRGYM